MQRQVTCSWKCVRISWSARQDLVEALGRRQLAAAPSSELEQFRIIGSQLLELFSFGSQGGLFSAR